jgi:DNA gyrase subunit A
LFSTHGRGTGGQRIFGNVDGKGEIIGAVSICDSDEIVCMTSQGKTLRIKATEIKQQGAGASGITIVKVSEPDYLVGIDKVQEKRDNE